MTHLPITSTASLQSERLLTARQLPLTPPRSRWQSYEQETPQRRVTLKIGGSAVVFAGTTVQLKCPVRQFDRYVVSTLPGSSRHLVCLVSCRVVLVDVGGEARADRAPKRRDTRHVRFGAALTQLPVAESC